VTQTEEQTEQKGADIVAESNQGETFFFFFSCDCPVGGGLPKPKGLLGLPQNRPCVSVVMVVMVVTCGGGSGCDVVQQWLVIIVVVTVASGGAATHNGGGSDLVTK
jgi:hypothetical protein